MGVSACFRRSRASPKVIFGGHWWWRGLPEGGSGTVQRWRVRRSRDRFWDRGAELTPGRQRRPGGGGFRDGGGGPGGRGRGPGGGGAGPGPGPALPGGVPDVRR